MEFFVVLQRQGKSTFFVFLVYFSTLYVEKHQYNVWRAVGTFFVVVFARMVTCKEVVFIKCFWIWYWDLCKKTAVFPLGVSRQEVVSRPCRVSPLSLALSTCFYRDPRASLAVSIIPSIVPLMKRTNFVLLKKAKPIDIERSSPKSVHNHSVYMVGSLNPRPSGGTTTSRSRR